MRRHRIPSVTALAIASLALLATVAWLPGPPPGAATQAPTDEGDAAVTNAEARGTDGATAPLKVRVEGVRNAQGTVRCALFTSPRGFPTDQSQALVRAEAPASAEGVECIFQSVEPGRYALAVYHDEDDDRRFLITLGGRPAEGRASSNDPDLRRGPPAYREAEFEVDAGASELTVQMVY